MGHMYGGAWATSWQGRRKMRRGEGQGTQTLPIQLASEMEPLTSGSEGRTARRILSAK